MSSVRIFTRTQHLPISLEAAWDFFSAPGNLPAITPPELGFRILSDPPSAIYPGHRSPGGVRVEDVIHYALPFGRLGQAVAGSLVRRKLEAIFAYRSGILSKRFGTA